MKYAYILATVLPLFTTFAHPLIDLDHESAIEKREASVKPLPSPNPLPKETDGVLPDNTIVNSIPNIDTLNNSCWTQPNHQFINHTDARYEADTCQICVIQAGLGPNAWYEAWVRDANNTAVGNMPAMNLGPGTSIGLSWTFRAADDSLILGVTPNQSPSFASAVTMMWGYETDAGPQMYFDPASKMGSVNCDFSNDSPDGTVTYFQCHFHCGIPFDLNH